jgi:hypothetical protein
MIRTEKLKAANRCFLSLNRGHHTHVCGKRGKVCCSSCKKDHHRSHCMEPKPTAGQTSTTSASVGKVDVASPDFTYLQTARVWVKGPTPTGLSILKRCVLGGGSQCSFVAKCIIYDLRREVIDHRELSVTAFETYPLISSSLRFVGFIMKGIWTNTSTPLRAFDNSHTFSTHPAIPHDVSLLGPTRKLQLTDPNDD